MATQDFENNNASLPLDTGEGHQYDRKVEAGHFPLSVSLGRSETKIRGAIIAQSGRSMVEMLGTLAIIGVLSVGGIAGYSYGMDKYRANRTMYDVNVRAVDVLAQFDATGDATLDGWKNEKTLYPITLEDETIGIQVSGVPTRVCELMVEGMEKYAKAVKINAEYVGENAGDCGDENTLVFYFDEEENKGCSNNGPISKCTTEDGQTGYCVLGTCMADGTQTCISETGSVENCPYDPACFVVADGTPTLISGLTCEKNGKQGVCSNGICQTENTLCGGIDCTMYATEQGVDTVCVGCQDNSCTYLIGNMCITQDNQIGICWLDGTCAISCTSHKVCGSGKYCNGLSQNGSGVCENVPSYTTETITFTDENGIEHTENWYFPSTSSDFTNWYTAKDVCSSSGWRMAKADDFYLSWSFDSEHLSTVVPNNRAKSFKTNINRKWLEDVYSENTSQRFICGGTEYIFPYDASLYSAGVILCTDK